MLTFSLAVNVRRFDRTGRWADRPTVWKNVSAFGALAENAHGTLSKGMTVTVTGTEVDNSYTPDQPMRTKSSPGSM